MKRLALFPLLAFVPLVVLPACMDNSNPGPLTAPPPTGSLEITTRTTGENIDSDGYRCVLDFSSNDSMGVNETATLTGLSVGDHSVVLMDIADNCQLSGSNPRWITVAAYETAQTTFSITCSG
jgi:hypothetical protein